ncbi:MAG: hypothetical protein GY946_18940 [bacterium]|nr:hypothetical protein [bacterium]
MLVREFLLPVWLTPIALVFVYFFAVYAAHEGAWKRLRIWYEGPVWRQRLAIALRCNLRLGTLRVIQGRALPTIARSDGFGSAWRAIGVAREQARDERDAEARARQRLIDNAGLTGTDESGQQLDQRESEETRKALRLAATFQTGQYRNEGEQYGTDIIDLAGPTLVRHGLPDGHEFSST